MDGVRKICMEHIQKLLKLIRLQVSLTLFFENLRAYKKMSFDTLPTFWSTSP